MSGLVGVFGTVVLVADTSDGPQKVVSVMGSVHLPLIIIIYRGLPPIQELKLMIQAPFEVLPSVPSLPQASSSPHRLDSYVRLQGRFINSSYGHYTGAFIEGITTAAKTVHEAIGVLSLPKCLRELVKKFMLSDLELVIVGHVCDLCQWNFKKPLLSHWADEVIRGQEQSQHPSTPHLMLLLELAGFYVKQYLGLEDQALAVAEFKQSEVGSRWTELYQQWLMECPRQMFTLSPRKVNRLYSQMSRNCQQRPHAKDYNHMVDQILQLSTTYSMIPADHKAQEKGKKRARNQIKQEDELREGKEPRRIRNSIITQSNMWLRGDSKREESSHNWMGSVGMPPPVNPANTVSNISNTQPGKKKISLATKDKRQTVTQHVNDFFTLDKKPSVKELTPRQPSNIGFRSDSFANLFNFNSVSDRIEPIPYNLRSSDMDVSKLWQ